MAIPVADEVKTCHLAGQLSAAEPLYRQILAQWPDHPAALQGLGVLLYQTGRAFEAVVCFRDALAALPDAPQVHANLGEALRVLGQLDEATAHLRQALAGDPSLPDALLSLGLALEAQEQPDEAAEALRAAIRLRPDLAVAQLQLGNLLVEQRDLMGACAAYRAVLEVDPDHVAALLNLGAVLVQLNDLDWLDEAELLCRRAAALAPEDVAVLGGLGDVFRAQNRLDEALTCYQEAIERDEFAVAAWYGVSQVLLRRGRVAEVEPIFTHLHAIEADPVRHHRNQGMWHAECHQAGAAAAHYRAALELDPEQDDVHHGLGGALLELGQLDAAELCFRAALRINPARSDTWVAWARLHAERGDLDVACAAARAALQIHPKLCDAYCRLASILRGRLPATDVQFMEHLLDHKYLTESTGATLRFNLATVRDAQGYYDQAAALLHTANALQNAARQAQGQEPYDPARFHQFVADLITVFDHDLFRRCQDWGIPDTRPIFVVGLPRSGTTLIEQILASHPAVHGAGELLEVSRLLDALPAIVGEPELHPLQAIARLDATTARAAAQRYLDHLDDLAPAGAERVVDKMPDNVLALGLIALLWPQAKVIWCRRDLRDVAVSCWHAHFKAMPWANCPDQIARRFQEYQCLARHWHTVKPLDWLDVRYEDLVADLEPEARRLIHFVGLPWDDRCLHFHESRRTVRTASLVQVRQPVHARSVGRWRRYEPYLDSWFRTLADLEHSS